MAEAKNHFTDGGAYDRMMGVWSRLVGAEFLDWLALPSGLRCIDVGCGNGAFTELLVERGKPSEVQGVDPSPEQIDFARKRHTAKVAEFRVGNAMAVPFPDDRFDAATMALVIFFVPDPAKSIAEMARVVRPGGTVAAYVWDMPGGGFPMEPILAEIRAIGHSAPGAPVPEISRIDALNAAWNAAGFEAVETRKITVQRTFADIEDYWTTGTLTGTIRSAVAALSEEEISAVKQKLRAVLPADASGRITRVAFANAVKGRVPD